MIQLRKKFAVPAVGLAATVIFLTITAVPASARIRTCSDTAQPGEDAECTTPSLQFREGDEMKIEGFLKFGEVRILNNETGALVGGGTMASDGEFGYTHIVKESGWYTVEVWAQSTDSQRFVEVSMDNGR